MYSTQSVFSPTRPSPIFISPQLYFSIIGKDSWRRQVPSNQSVEKGRTKPHTPIFPISSSPWHHSTACIVHSHVHPSPYPFSPHVFTEGEDFLSWKNKGCQGWRGNRRLTLQRVWMTEDGVWVMGSHSKEEQGNIFGRLIQHLFIPSLLAKYYLSGCPWFIIWSFGKEQAPVYCSIIWGERNFVPRMTNPQP